MGYDKDGKTKLPPNIYYRAKQQTYIADKVYKGQRILRYSKKLKGKDGVITLLNNAIYEIDHGLYGKEEEKKAPQKSIPQDTEKSGGVGQGITFDEAMRLYMEQWKPTLKRSTKRTYSAFYKEYLQPYIGGMELEKLTDREVEAVYASWVKTGMMQGTFNSAAKTLNMLLNTAVRKKLVKENVMHTVEKPKNLVVKERRVMTEDEREVFLSYAKESWYYEYYVTGLFFGGRAGETAGLCEDAVDFDREEIQVKRNLLYDEQGYYIDTPKTKESIRVIDMLPETREALKSAIEKRDKIWAAVGKGNIPKELRHLDFIFVNRQGGLVSKCIIANDMRRICRKINEDRPSFKAIHPHVLRRTFATLLNENGANLAVIQELLGHTSIDTTRKYVGVNSSFRKAEIRKLSANGNHGEKGGT